MKNILNIYNIKNLKTEINRYGYSFKTKDFIMQSLLIIVVVLFIAYLSKLNLKCMLILIGISLFIAPFVIRAWFLQDYNIKKFVMLSDYLGNIIPIFVQKTKIRYTLGELLQITNGSVCKSIIDAIAYLDNAVDDPDMNLNALKIIENEFPNSRVKSVHKLLVSVENSNSIAYKDVCQNMYEDIETWTKRVYSFQKDLKNRRTKLLILCLATLLMNSVFVYLYVSNDYFVGFTSLPIYQISSLVFIAIILIIITLILTKLHGEWLVNDLNYQNDDYLKRQYLLYKKGKPKIKIIDILISAICFALAVYLFLKEKTVYALIFVVLGIYALLVKRIKYKGTYKRIKKALTIEFPVWLREISLSLNSLTVLNAIDNSLNNVSYPMRKEIRKFLNAASKDPTSIVPYNEFLDEYGIEDVNSSMKVLYAIQNVGKDEVKERISNLIIRNQEMLNKAEKIRNDDSIGGIEALGYVPTLVFSVQMMVSMFAMFSYMMASIQGALA